MPLKKTGAKWGIEIGTMQQRSMSGARNKAHHINDAGNLKQIGLALRMYSGDHDGRFPDDLGELHDGTYLTSGKVYTCPNSDTKPPESGDDIRAGQCDYVYLDVIRDRTGRYSSC